MHSHGGTGSALAQWALRLAIVVFTSLGLVELAVAAAFHKVALGVDGAHNLVDGAVYFLNLRAPYWASADEYSAWTCIGEPGAPLFASSGVTLSAIGFTAYESLAGGGSEAHELLAVTLLIASLVLNGSFAAVMYFDQRRRHQDQSNRHHHNALVHAVWDSVSALAGLVTYSLILAGLPDWLDLMGAWTGTSLVLFGHRHEISDGLAELKLHRGVHDHHNEPDHAP